MEGITDLPFDSMELAILEKLIYILLSVIRGTNAESRSLIPGAIVALVIVLIQTLLIIDSLLPLEELLPVQIV